MVKARGKQQRAGLRRLLHCLFGGSVYLAQCWRQYCISCALLMCSFAMAGVVRASDAGDALWQYHHDHVLGTSLTMKIEGSQVAARAIESAVLAEIQRLDSVLSNYRADSEVSRLNAAGGSQSLSADLLAVVEQCDRWQQQLPMAFSCRLGEVIAWWDSAEAQQLVPQRPQVRALARRALNSSYGRDQLAAGKTNGDFHWHFGGIGKGYVLDQAMAVARAEAQRQGAGEVLAIALDIGGDGVYWQVAERVSNWQVGLAQPGALDDSGQRRLGDMTIKQGAIAYSGDGSRSRTIGRRSFSHILTPRDGWPKFQALTAVVRAGSALAVDALATALATMDIRDALDWVNQRPEYAALLIDHAGRQHSSANWYQHFTPSAAANAPAQLAIQFKLPRLRVSNYRKPYVALWLEDDQGEPVKALLLLGDNERWASDNRHWWRAQGRTAPEFFFQGFARPTRRAGVYDLTWDGRDDYGQSLPSGNYTLHIEAAREHGDHERLSLPFVLGAEGFRQQVKGSAEIDYLELRSSQ